MKFWDYVEKTETCWLWTGPISNTGYGLTYYDGKQRSAHRASYLIHTGPIPSGLVLDHLCRVRSCVNPAHLEAVTQKLNVHRGVGSGANNHIAQTHCKYGHLFTPENLVPNKQGWRVCRTCHQRHGLDTKARRKLPN